MDGQRGAERGDLPSEERRRAALVAFIGAGMPSPPPSTALLVAALAGARRAVAMHQACGLAVDEWLAGEVRLRGIRENAAILAVLEMPGRREEIAQAYRRQHPDRVGTLSDLLAVLDLPGPAASALAVRAYGGRGSSRRPVWARKASMRAARYWMLLSRFLMIAVSWSTSAAARLPRPFFMFAQAPSIGCP